MYDDDWVGKEMSIEEKEAMEDIKRKTVLNGVITLLSDIYKYLQNEQVSTTLLDIPFELMKDVAEEVLECGLDYDCYHLWDLVYDVIHCFTEEEALEEFGSTEGLIHNPKYPNLYIIMDYQKDLN